MQKLKLNDEVIVLTGKDKGKKGNILKLNFKKSTVLVKGINIVKKTVKATKEMPAGDISSKESPLNISNVAVVSPKTGKGSRVRIENKDGKKVRVLVKCGTVLK